MFEGRLPDGADLPGVGSPRRRRGGGCGAAGRRRRCRSVSASGHVVAGRLLDRRRAGDRSGDRHRRRHRRRRLRGPDLGGVRRRVQRDRLERPVHVGARRSRPCVAAALRRRRRAIRVRAHPDRGQRLRDGSLHRRRGSRRQHRPDPGQLLDRARQGQADPVHQGGAGRASEHSPVGDPLDGSDLDEAGAVRVGGHDDAVRRRLDQDRRADDDGARTVFRELRPRLRAEGITVEAIGAQNEPNYTGTYPTCGWSPAPYATFIGQYLGPAVAAAGLRRRSCWAP